MKRIFDVVISMILLLTLLPILVLTILLIKKDGGPAFYFQNRVGRYGKEFAIYKFRSMVTNASDLGGYSTENNDKRITKIGKVIRKTSIDELPQLINVIKGDMSIVGPRPNVPLQREKYTQEQWDIRNSVLPGITGLAQAIQRSNASPEEKLKLDLDYIKMSGFMFDIKIIALTIKQVLFKGGN